MSSIHEYTTRVWRTKDGRDWLNSHEAVEWEAVLELASLIRVRAAPPLGSKPVAHHYAQFLLENADVLWPFLKEHSERPEFVSVAQLRAERDAREAEEQDGMGAG